MVVVTDEEKAHLLRILPLGVDLFTACIQMHLSLDQIDSLEHDEDFGREVEVVKRREIVRLMELYSKTTEKAAKLKLDYRGLRERLELLDPSNYSKKAIESRISGKENTPKNQVQFYIPENGRDNVN